MPVVRPIKPGYQRRQSGDFDRRTAKVHLLGRLHQGDDPGSFGPADSAEEVCVMASENSAANRLRITLAPAAVKRLVEADIRCTPDVSLEYQRAAGRYVLRGRESGGAVKALGRYVSFCAGDGTQQAWFMRPDSPVANGDHAIVIAPALVSVEMFRFEHTYELLIVRHTINQ